MHLCRGGLRACPDVSCRCLRHADKYGSARADLRMDCDCSCRHSVGDFGFGCRSGHVPTDITAQLACDIGNLFSDSRPPSLVYALALNPQTCFVQCMKNQVGYA